MGNWALVSMPTQELDAFIQKSLRPFEDCQKQIDKAVDTICAALHEAEEQLPVTDVAKVSSGLRSGCVGARRFTGHCKAE